MSKQSYIDDLKSKAHSIDKRLAAARKRFESGEVVETVLALKEIAWLETRHKDLAERIKAAETNHAEEWSEWHTGLRKELDGVLDMLERIIVKHT